MSRGNRGGRPPVPTKTKIIRHTFRKDRAKNEPEPQVLTLTPDPPRGLPRVARRIWKAAAAELVKLGMLTILDTPLFESACRAKGEAAELTAGFHHVKGDNGKVRQRTLYEYTHEAVPLMDKTGRAIEIDGKPLIVEMVSKTRLLAIGRRNDLDRYADRVFADFGFTPAARSRINLVAGDKPAESPIKRMMQGE